MYAYRLDVGVVESVVSLIHSQLEHILASAGTSDSGRRELRAAERNLGDFLVFVRRIASSRILRKLLAGKEWTDTLLKVLGQQASCNDSALPRIQALRPRLLAIQLLASVLPSLDPNTNSEHKEQVSSHVVGNRKDLDDSLVC